MRRECHLVYLKETGGLLDASVGASILEGLDEMSTVKPPEAARAAAPFGRLHQRNHVSRRKLD
jgi:hypothetical protein